MRCKAFFEIFFEKHHRISQTRNNFEENEIRGSKVASIAENGINCHRNWYHPFGFSQDLRYRKIFKISRLIPARKLLQKILKTSPSTIKKCLSPKTRFPKNSRPRKCASQKMRSISSTTIAKANLILLGQISFFFFLFNYIKINVNFLFNFVYMMLRYLFESWALGWVKRASFGFLKSWKFWWENFISGDFFYFSKFLVAYFDHRLPSSSFCHNHTFLIHF